MSKKYKMIDTENLGDRYIQELPNGKYRVEIDLGYSNDGKRKRFVKRVDTKEQAIEIRNKTIYKINEGRITPDANMSFNLLSKSFILYKAEDLAISTLQKYRSDLNNYILPYIGALAIKDISKEHLIELYEYLGTEYQSKTQKGLSGVSLGHVHATIRAILNYAKNESYLTHNVAEKLGKKAPTLESENERQAYTVEEVYKIFQLVKKENLRFKAIVELALVTCLRRGEIAGLNWGDIDIVNDKVRVTKSVTVVSGKGLIVNKPKTKSSIATISLGSNVVTSLLEYKKELEILGFDITEDTPVFLSSNGRRLSPDKITHQWKAFVDRNDIPKYCFHSLRHTGLTLMTEKTGDIVAVSKHARHSRPSTTEDIYLHSNPKRDEMLAECIDNIRYSPDSIKNEKQIQEEMLKKQEEMAKTITELVRQLNEREKIS